MHSKFFSVVFHVWVFVSYWLEAVESQDSFGQFTRKPPDILRVEIGKEATFIWEYTAPSGTSTALDKWCKIDSVLKQCTNNILMVKSSGQSTPVVSSTNTEYASRTVGISPLTMKIRDVRLSDDSVFEFSALFTNGISYFDRVRLMVLVKPVITLKTTGNRVVSEGEKLKLECGVTQGNPKPYTIEWWHNNVMLTSVKSNFDAPLIFNQTLRKHKGIYRCMAKNDAGLDSYDVNVDVVYPPENVYIIPSSNGVVRIHEGRNLTLDCRADGTPKPTYSWTRIKSLYREKLVEKSVKSTWFFKRVDKLHADQYECAAVNIHGRTTATVILDVLYRPERMNFTINNHNTSIVNAMVGSTVNMSCWAMSSPEADFRIGFQGSPTPKVIGKFYLIESVKVTDSGIYECVASNGIGEPVRKLAQLIVVVAPSDIVVRGSPQNRLLNAGTNLVLTCEMKGTPRPNIYWTLNRVRVAFDDIRRESNGTTLNAAREEIHYSRIEFKPLRRFDDGEYTCFGQNYGGVLEKKYLLEVNYAPYIIQFPKNVSVLEFQSAELSCKAVGKPPLSAYLWKQNGIVKTTEASERIYFPQANRRHGGRYSCAGINSVGAGPEAVAFLTVMYKPELTISPPLSQTVNASVNIRLQCNATGVPKPKILWTKDEVSDTNILHVGEVFILRNVGYKEKGTYFCKASNKIGNTTAKSILLINHAPVITTKNPSSTKVGSDIGDRAPPVTLVCTVDAYPPAVISWMRGSTPIEEGTQGLTVKVTGGTSTLTVVMKDDSRRGNYLCTAKNKLGTASQQYEILAKSLPDPPVYGSLKATDELEESDPPTSKVRLTWIPGYNGGYTVKFLLSYRERGQPSFRQMDIGTSPNNIYYLRGMKTETFYEFTMRAVNERGQSGEYLPYLVFKTKVAPPKRGSASVRRYGSSGTQVEVSWTINDYSKAKSVIVRYKRVIDSRWRQQVTDNINGTLVISSLESEQNYEFQVFVVYNDGSRGMPVSAGQLYPGGGVTSGGRSGLKKQDIIAIVIGVGGFLLILIIVCTLVILKKKKKHGIDGQFELKEISFGRGKGGNIGYSTGGSDVVRAAGLHDFSNEYDDARASDPLTQKPPGKESPVSYDGHGVYYDGTDDQNTSFQATKPPVTNTPAYSSFSALANAKKPLLSEPEPATKSGSRTSLVSGRAAEISRRTRNPFESLDYRGRRTDDPYDDELEAERPPYRNNGRDRDYRTEPKPKGARGSSSGGLSTDDDLPSPPPFIREALTNVHSDSERVPGSLGERLGRNRHSRPSPQHSPASQRSGVSSSQYRSDTEYIEDDGDNYVGYLV